MNLFSQFSAWFEQHPVAGEFVVGGVILTAGVAGYFIFRKLVIVLIRKAAERTRTTFDNHLLEGRVFNRLAWIIPVLLFNGFSFLMPSSGEIISRLMQIAMVGIVVWTISSILSAVNRFYETLEVSRERPIKGYLQIINLIVYLFGSIIIIGLIINQRPWALLSGIGAMTAILLLIFKDTILSFVAGIQITSYNLLHVGDWIEMPEYGVDGDVIDIALHTVRVQNWDKTITVIPTYKLTEKSFKNWRGMQQTGGRRIKRALYIDQNSVRACDDELIEKFSRVRLLREYIDRKQQELEEHNARYGLDDGTVPINTRRLTNLGTFRKYTEAYLEDHPRIRNDLTLMTRQLPPGPNGIPIEIYAFTNTTDWIEYESIQADIFDHLLSVVPEFELKIFQNPTGQDFRNGLKRYNFQERLTIVQIDRHRSKAEAIRSNSPVERPMSAAILRQSARAHSHTARCATPSISTWTMTSVSDVSAITCLPRLPAAACVCPICGSVVAAAPPPAAAPGRRCEHPSGRRSSRPFRG